MLGIIVEAGPWPCPLTILEQTLEDKAGMTAYSQPFLVHYLDKLVYPDISLVALTAGAITVCAANLAVYALRYFRNRAYRTKYTHFANQRRL